MSTSTGAWEVERLVACERSSPPAHDDDWPARVEDTFAEDEIRAIRAANREAWRERNEAMRIREEAEYEDERHARRAKKILGDGLSPVEHGRIMREAARWKRFDNGRHCSGSDGPLLSASAREVLGHLVEHVNWLTRERDTTAEALRVRTGYRHVKTIWRALGELLGLGLIVRLEGFQRVRVRLEFRNAEELRGLMMRAATRRVNPTPKRPSAVRSEAAPKATPSSSSGPCLSSSLLLGSVPELTAPHGRAELSGRPKTLLDLEGARACESKGAAVGGETLTATPGTATPGKTAVPPSAARLSTARKAPGRDESHGGKGSTKCAPSLREPEASKGLARDGLASKLGTIPPPLAQVFANFDHLSNEAPGVFRFRRPFPPARAPEKPLNGPTENGPPVGAPKRPDAFTGASSDAAAPILARLDELSKRRDGERILYRRSDERPGPLPPSNKVLDFSDASRAISKSRSASHGARKRSGADEP